MPPYCKYRDCKLELLGPGYTCIVNLVMHGSNIPCFTGIPSCQNNASCYDGYCYCLYGFTGQQCEHGVYVLYYRFIPALCILCVCILCYPCMVLYTVHSVHACVSAGM